MRSYLNICKEILEKGVRKSTRTGIDAFVIPPTIIQHDMSDGFPLLTTKKVGPKSIFTELQFFLLGKTDKQWLQDRHVHIWDEWCNPRKVPYGNDSETKKLMGAEKDLGPIYGFQWKHFGAEYRGIEGTLDEKGEIIDYNGKGEDQLLRVANTLKNNPLDRRMIVSAWNPQSLDEMALPPCHYGFQVGVRPIKEGNKKVYALDLAWNQRSVDVPLGLPYNVASYGALLHLFTKQANITAKKDVKFIEGILTGFLMDTHIYENQLEGIKEQLSRDPRPLPRIETGFIEDMFHWNRTCSKVLDYDPHPTISFPLAI